MWFINSEVFREWKSGERRCLWLHGIPGCGKTVLSSTIVENLRNDQEDSSHIVLDFFFDFSEAEKQSLDKLARSLIAQLCSKCVDSRQELNSLFSSCEDGRRQPTTKSLLATFQRMVGSANKAFIVLDALDECSLERDLVPWIKALSSSGKSNIHVLATSRREGDIELGFKSWLAVDNILSIQQSEVDSDIRAYIRGTLRAKNDFQRWQSQSFVLNEIEKKIMEKADGM